jgi:hypothetical protein
MYADMMRRLYNNILTQYTDSTQFGISNDNFKADSSSSAGASTASATTTASVNITTPISAQVVSASDAVSSAVSSASSVIASASSSVASQISSASSAITSAVVSYTSISLYIPFYLTFPVVLSFLRSFQQAKLCHWLHVQCCFQRCQLHEHSHQIRRQLCIFSFQECL